MKQSLLTTEVMQIRVSRHPMSTIETENWWLHRMDFETLIIVCYAAELLSEPYLGNKPLLGKSDDFIYFSGHFGVAAILDCGTGLQHHLQVWFCSPR